MEPFTVACCQLQARDLGDAESSLGAILAALDEAGAAGADLVLLPECSYPAYYLGDADPYAKAGVRPFAEVCGLLAERARRYRYWLAAGIAVPHANGRLTNSGVVFGPDGEVRGRYDKSFLSHFDNDWFTPGSEFPVFDAGFCRFGILICADGRLPEIARMLRVNGAEVICDLTAWVSWALTPEALNTTQCEYLMPVRAFENGAWVAAADKWGTENGTIVYAGRSAVIDPAGTTRACLASTGDGLLVYRIEPIEIETIARRPALYANLTAHTETLPAVALEGEPLVPARAGGRIGVIPDGGDFEASHLARRFAAMRAQDCDLVVAAGTRGLEGWQVELPHLEAVVRERGGTLAFAVMTTGCNWSQSAVLVTPNATVEHVATHGRGLALGETNAPMVPTSAGNVGLLCGEEAFVPEVARCLALDGADVLAWTAFEDHHMAERVMRTRADESRVYVAAAWSGGGLVASPDGALLTAVPAGLGVGMSVSSHLAFSRWKERAPGTHVIRGRTPEAYGPLVRP